MSGPGAHICCHVTPTRVTTCRVGAGDAIIQRTPPQPYGDLPGCCISRLPYGLIRRTPKLRSQQGLTIVSHMALFGTDDENGSQFNHPFVDASNDGEGAGISLKTVRLINTTML
jgi:hypothetical protein